MVTHQPVYLLTVPLHVYVCHNFANSDKALKQYHVKCHKDGKNEIWSIYTVQHLAKMKRTSWDFYGKGSLRNVLRDGNDWQWYTKTTYSI